MTYPPKEIMTCALFLATKTENYTISLRRFASHIPDESTTADEIIAPEFLLMQSLRFMFDVRHPFRGLEGGIMELTAINQGMDVGAPHSTTAGESLRKELRNLPPLPDDSSRSSTTGRLARAHYHTREMLKSAAQLTDAYFLFTPAQIWLAAFLLVDRPLAEFYLGSKFPAQSKDDDVISSLRGKLSQTLADCGRVLQSYEPLSNDPAQMQNLKRIAKKLYHCQNPDKVIGQKTGSEGDSDDRAVKKRRLDDQDES